MNPPQPSSRGLVHALLTWGTMVAALLAWLLFAPVAIAPQAWQAPPDAGHTGVHAVNQKLATLNTVGFGGGRDGPEHIVVQGDHLFTALSNGDVVRMPLQGGPAERLVNTGGRPLGLALSAEGGTLYIADANLGLLSLDLQSVPPRLDSLLTEVDSPVAHDRVRYADGVAVDAQGRVWLTDASRRFDPQAMGSTFEASVLDILEHSCTGRLLTVDPRTKRAHEALTGLCFPNGLVFSADGRSLFLVETGTYRILQIDLARLSALSGPQGNGAAPTLAQSVEQRVTRVMLDNLPGYPDNLTRGLNGRLWVGLTKPRSKVIDWAADRPWVRTLTLRLPRALWPVPPAYGHVLAFDEAGRIVDDLQDPAGTYPETTGATEAGGRLFIQSLHAPGVGSLPYTGPRP